MPRLNEAAREAEAEPEPPTSKVPPTVIGQWVLRKLLGSGYSGSIYEAQHMHSGQKAAIKLQHVRHECPTNYLEQRCYSFLHGAEGIPRLWASGIVGEWDYLVIDLLGSSLDKLLSKSGKSRMDLRSVCSIAMQVISRLETMHSRGVLHRDIQLGNCVIGLPPDETKIYLIDFGFSKQYIDPKTHIHIPDSRRKRDFIGNYWFSSIRVHCKGRVPSRRDDLEAAALMFIHLLTPNGLPWTRNGVPKTDEAHDILKQAKLKGTPEALCYHIPEEFEEFLRYTRSLRFSQMPDYQRWILQFEELASYEGFPPGHDFIWPPPETRKVKAPPPPPYQPPTNVTWTLDDVINELGNMNLGVLPRPVLGDRQNIQEPARKPAKHQRKKHDLPTSLEKAIEYNHEPQRQNQHTKAQKLKLLRQEMSDAVESLTFSSLLVQFISAMQLNGGKTLTKEATAFLQTLHGKLANPSVIIVVPNESITGSESSKASDGHVKKMDVLSRLRASTVKASDHRQLADLLAQFMKAMETNRTLTKGSFDFLETFSRRLQVIKS